MNDYVQSKAAKVRRSGKDPALAAIQGSMAELRRERRRGSANELWHLRRFCKLQKAGQHRSLPFDANGLMDAEDEIETSEHRQERARMEAEERRERRQDGWHFGLDQMDVW